MHIINPRATTRTHKKTKNPKTKTQRAIANKSVLEINWSTKNTQYKIRQAKREK